MVKWLDHINLYGWILIYIYIINMLQTAMLSSNQMSFYRLDTNYIDDSTSV